MVHNDDNEIEEENFDEFDDDEFGEEESFDDFSDGKEATLADTIRDKPIAKVGIIVGIIVLLYILFSFFIPEDLPDPSSVPTPSDIAVAPGTQDVPENIRKAIEESDDQRRELAEQTGQSALPTLIEPPARQIELEQSDLGEEDPLQRWRALQQERLRKEQLDTQFIEQDNVDTGISDEDLRALADAMATQMQAILQNQSEPIYQNITITPENYLDQFEEDDVAITGSDFGGVTLDGAFVDTDGDGVSDVVEERIAEILVPAGEIEYAQLLLEANSDIPSPVLARISGGPLDGSRILGTFSVENEVLALTFNTLVKDGISQPIDAIAIDPSSSLAGLATDVDQRYFTRVVLPAAADFIEGVADAFSEQDQTTITIQGDTTTAQTDRDVDFEQELAEGIEEAAGQIGDILDERANNTQILVRIRAGTPIGLLFLAPVLKEE